MQELCQRPGEGRRQQQLALNVNCLKIMGIFLQNVLSWSVWICVSGFSWQQFLGERSEMSRCGIFQWYILLLLSRWKWNETGSSVMQIWIDAAIFCVTLWGKRGRGVTPTTLPSHTFYIALPGEITNIQKNKVYYINESRFIKLQV